MLKFFLALCLLSIHAIAQNSKVPQSYSDGMEAMRNSDFKSAVVLFRQATAEKPNLIAAHYYLGIALELQNEYGEALDVFGHLLKLKPHSPDDLFTHYEIGKLYIQTQDYSRGIEEYRWLKAKEPAGPHIPDAVAPDAVAEDTNKSKALSLPAELAQILLDMLPPEVAELNNLPPTKIVFAQKPELATPGSGAHPSQSSELRASGAEQPVPKEQMDKQGTPLRNAEGVKPMSATMRPKVLYQEKAKYTEIARRNCTQGTVILSVIFETSGRLSGLRVIRGLPDGLTQSAIRAAHKIRFNPAIRDGAPVNVRGSLEFSFNLY